MHFETYKQLKEVAKEQDPGISKSEIYEKLLEPFHHSKRTEMDPETGKSRTLYSWKYPKWNKEYTKIWNLLDHVRMHEGIRPYKCDAWGKTFTQKGNLKKHSKQHLLVTLKDRKRFEWNICHKKYTERYNLMVSFSSKINPFFSQLCIFKPESFIFQLLVNLKIIMSALRIWLFNNFYTRYIVIV